MSRDDDMVNELKTTFRAGTPLMRNLFISRMVILLAWLVMLSAPAAAHADLQDSVQEMIRAGGLNDAQVAVVVIDLDNGDELVALKPDSPMIPASNMKLVTAATALHILGPKFVFETQLLLIDNDPHKGATLVVRGDGDPAFGDPKLIEQHAQLKDVEDMLNLWVEAVRKAGVKRVNHLIIDDRVFDQNFVHPSWPKGQLNRWYCAQVAGLNFFDNCLDVYAKPSSLGETPAVTVKPYAPNISTTNAAKTGKANTFWVSRKVGSNQLGFHGLISHEIAPVPVTVHDPPMTFAAIFADRLARQGVTVAQVSRPTLEQRIFEGKLLHTVRTPIAAVLGRCNKDSQNLFGEALFKRLGRQFTGAPGGFDNGASAVRTFLSTRALPGGAAASVTIADGGGMSRDNQVTARALAMLLQYMHHNDPDPERRTAFIESLSIGGVDGTLRNRFNKNFHGVVRGKSGYIRGVSTLSGYLTLSTPNQPDGRPSPPKTLAFSILINNSNRTLSEMHTVQNRIIAFLDQAMHTQPQNRPR